MKQFAVRAAVPLRLCQIQDLLSTKSLLVISAVPVLPNNRHVSVGAFLEPYCLMEV